MLNFRLGQRQLKEQAVHCPALVVSNNTLNEKIGNESFLSDDDSR